MSPSDAERVEAFKRFVAQKPDDPFVRYALAMAYRGAGQLEEAVREFELVLERSPDYVPTYLMAGQTLEQLGRKEDAAVMYQRGIGVASKASNDHARSELQSALDLIRGG
jgi:tetratricopeptide (TPR) repeat protein